MEYYYYILSIICAYILGSIPSSVWIGKLFFKTDVRKYGSGNAGATNTIRVLGLKAGIPVLIIDAAKGWLAVKTAYLFQHNFSSDNQYITFQAVLGLLALTGHIFPVFAGFKGGKGVATLLGIAVALYPVAIIWSVLIFFAVFFISRYVSLSSIITAVSFPFIVVFYCHENHILLTVFAILIAIFVPLTHRKNIIRLMKGEENKLSFRKKNNP